MAEGRSGRGAHTLHPNIFSRRLYDVTEILVSLIHLVRRRRRLRAFAQFWSRGSILLPLQDCGASGLDIGAFIQQPLLSFFIDVDQTAGPPLDGIQGTVHDDMVCSLVLRATLAGRRWSQSPFVHG